MFQSKGKKNLKKLRSAIEIVISANAPKRSANGLAFSREYVLARFDQIAENGTAKRSCAEYGDDFDYERAAYNMVYNICETGLGSGTLNVLPGTLSLVGQAVFELFDNILHRFEKNEWLSHDECVTAYKDVKNAIRELG